jgi:hypothetical protein
MFLLDWEITAELGKYCYHREQNNDITRYRPIFDLLNHSAKLCDREEIACKTTSLGITVTV